ncbi:MAG: dethiobiotin synthase [Gammaproteobacteria bacterium]|nr:dethiobiotin synthase [Gammaproteobacteria bacterium]
MLKTNPVLKGFFITGSDTGVGKTWVSCQLINQLKQAVPSLKVRKPVESGCEVLVDNQLLPADGRALFEANDNRESLQLVTPLRYKAAVSPDRAARLESQSIYLNDLQQAVTANIHVDDLILVEGAGGFYSPIAQDGLNADLAKLLMLEVIVVIEDRLGAINQSLLTIRAIENEGLTVKAVILNQQKQQKTTDLNNLDDLKNRTDYPVYSCQYNGLLPAIDLAIDDFI